MSGNVGVAVGNLLGGIAIQTVVLVALDAFGVRGTRPLTFMAASLSLVLEAALVVAVLLVVLAGSQLPGSLIVCPADAGTGADRDPLGRGAEAHRRAAGASLPWADRGEAPDSQEKPRGHARTTDGGRTATQRRVSTTRAVATVFGVAALLTLVAGVAHRAERRGLLRRYRSVRRALRLHGAGGRDLAAGAVHRPDGGAQGRLQARDGGHLRRQRLPAGAVPRWSP